MIFFFIVGGRVPSYLGSSFAFIGPVLVATGAAVGRPEPEYPAGARRHHRGRRALHADRPGRAGRGPPLGRAADAAGGDRRIVAAIGLVLAPIAINSASGIGARQRGRHRFRSLDRADHRARGRPRRGLCAGLWRRLPVLVGGAVGYVAYSIFANLMGYGPAIDFTKIGAGRLVRPAELPAPVFDCAAMILIAPVAIILVAENLGHIKAIGAMTGRNLDPYLGRAFMGDGIATMVSGFRRRHRHDDLRGEHGRDGGHAHLFDRALHRRPRVIAILLGFSPKFGALICTIPGPVLGGLSIVVFGLIAATAGRIWVENRVDFSNPRNLITVAVALVLGAGNFKLALGGFTLDGIGTATFGAIILYHLLRDRRRSKLRLPAPRIRKRPNSVTPR